MLYTPKESNIGDLYKFLSPLYHLLRKLPSLTDLTLHIQSVTLYGDTWHKPADIDLGTQLPLKALRFFPPRVQESDVWCHDWETDVTALDDDAPLVYANPWMILSPPHSPESNGIGRCRNFLLGIPRLITT